MEEQQENRREDRVPSRLAVDVGGAIGVTRDVSQSGLYFETDAQYAVGGEINLSMEIDTPGGRMMLKCHGNIVRLEQHGTKIGVAVKIIESTMAPAGQT